MGVPDYATDVIALQPISAVASASYQEQRSAAPTYDVPVSPSYTQVEAAKAESIVLPPVQNPEQLKAMVAQAGLQWVETSSDRIDAEPYVTVPSPRVARQRKPRPTIVAEPLQQVETRPGGE